VEPKSLRGFQFVREAKVQVTLNLMRRAMPLFYAALHGEDPQQPGQWYLRIMLRSREAQPLESKQQIIEQVTRIAQEEFPGEETTSETNSPPAEVTGFYVLLASLVDSILADQWRAFVVATAGIWVMMLIVQRSAALATVALVPNILPILLVTGLMGWRGVPINMGSAMIAAVSMGLSIDSSIHWLAAFRRARRSGHSVDAALRVVHHSVGRALVLSTLALIVGFAVLCASEFVPTIYFGVLVSLAMLGGLAGNLLVLPVLVKLVER
jgi:hypothetical protein